MNRRTSDTTSLLNVARNKALGAYYTPESAATFMAKWLLRRPNDRILEPSFGDGAFLSAVASVSAVRGFQPTVTGVELARDAFARVESSGLIDPNGAIFGDFLATEPFGVDAVIGNPPYVRLRNLPDSERDVARASAREVLGTDIDSTASVWVPFILHATQFLTIGGRLAMVLPYEMTHVRYAKRLWRFLAQSFGELRVIRVRERLFDDILQETILLFADHFGQSTGQVGFSAYETVNELCHSNHVNQTELPIDRIVGGERPFVEALLPSDTRSLLAEKVTPYCRPVSESVKFNIGYVCGDKQFFHPSREAIERFGIDETALRPALSNGRTVKCTGLFTGGMPIDELSYLFSPEDLTNEADRSYVEHGEQTGVDLRYKCRVRDPWYRVPGVEVPALIVPVFAETPRLLVNDAELVATNSFMCGHTDSLTALHFAARWYTSLTLLETELRVHSLGGGVFVFVPRELAAMRIPIEHPCEPGYHAKLDAAMKAGPPIDAYRLGDKFVLRNHLGLSDSEIEMIRSATETLREWRQSARPTTDRLNQQLDLQRHPRTAFAN